MGVSRNPCVFVYMQAMIPVMYNICENEQVCITTEGTQTHGRPTPPDIFTTASEQKESLLLHPNRRNLYYCIRTEGIFTIASEQKESLLLHPNRRNLYCCIRAEGIFTIQSLRAFRRTDPVRLCIGSLVLWCLG